MIVWLNDYGHPHQEDNSSSSYSSVVCINQVKSHQPLFAAAITCLHAQLHYLQHYSSCKIIMVHLVRPVLACSCLIPAAAPLRHQTVGIILQLQLKLWI